MEEARPAVLARGAEKDGVFEGFGLQATAGAGGVRVSYLLVGTKRLI